MQLPESHIASLAELIASPGRREAVENHIRRHPRWDWRVAISDDGEIRAAVALIPISARESQLGRVYVRDDEAWAEAADAIREAVDAARQGGMARIMTRVYASWDSDAYRATLVSVGFRARGERVEFKTPLDELPRDEPGPLAWRVASGVDEAAALLERVVLGDPDHDPSDGTAEEFIRAEHEDPDTVVRMEIGSLDGKDVAFVLAEVAPATGWSTLSYFGLVPESRGRSLARVAHRHGFAVMRSLGGTLYHGGCSTANAAMIRVFEANGCREHARMTTLVLEIDDD